MNANVLFVLHYACLVLALSFGSRNQRIVTGAFILALDVYNFLFNLEIGTRKFLDYIRGSTYAASTLMAIDMLVRERNPRLEFKKLRDLSPCPAGVVGRVLWAIELASTPRGIGWSFQARGVPPFNEPRVRAQFIKSRVLSAVTSSGFVITFWYASRAVDVNFTRFDEPSSSPVNALLRQAFIVYYWMAVAQLAIQGIYDTVSVISVASRLSLPIDWPRIFGSLRKSRTVRGAWGYTWHQILRRVLTSSANFVARDILRLHPGSVMSKGLAICVAFVTSAFIHSVGDYLVTGGELWFSWRFFALQPVAIAFESAIIFIGKKIGLHRSGRVVTVVGYIWVFLWFTISVPLLWDGLFRSCVSFI